MHLKTELPGTGCLTPQPGPGTCRDMPFPGAGRTGPRPPVRGGGAALATCPGPGPRDSCGAGRGPWRPGGAGFLPGSGCHCVLGPRWAGPRPGENTVQVRLFLGKRLTHDVDSEGGLAAGLRRPGRAVIGTAHRDVGAGAGAHGARAPGAFPIKAAAGPSRNRRWGFWVGHEPG